MGLRRSGEPRPYPPSLPTTVDEELMNRIELGEPAPALRCDRCRQYLVICGHDQPFLERVKTHRIDKASLKVKTR